MSERLTAGQLFPATSITLTEGGSMMLPDDMVDGYKVVIIFRGSW
jgi:hypothetical protein